MKDWRSQSHVKWDCKYHVVIIPKYRRRRFYGSLRAEIGKIRCKRLESWWFPLDLGFHLIFALKGRNISA